MQLVLKWISLKPRCRCGVKGCTFQILWLLSSSKCCCWVHPQNRLLETFERLLNFSWHIKRTFKGQIVVSSWAIELNVLWFKREQSARVRQFSLQSCSSSTKMFGIFLLKNLIHIFPSSLSWWTLDFLQTGAFLSYEVVALVKKWLLLLHGCAAKEFPLSYTFFKPTTNRVQKFILGFLHPGCQGIF